MDILSHPSVGGFVSHCGWNSILESIWFGVPIAAWPLFAEQQLNAFQIIVEMGFGVEIKMDYRKEVNSDGNDDIVSAGEIERGVRCLMELDNGKRERLKEMSGKSRKAVESDEANEFGVPSYIVQLAYLGLQFYMQALHDEQIDSNAELVVPCLANPLPAKVLLSAALKKEWLPGFLDQSRRFRETKGIMVNTFDELESQAINSFSNCNTPPVYPVGPIWNLNRDGDHDVESDKYKDIRQWLDDQPVSSVMYLYFGSMGSFGVDQVKEIACGLEQSGHRFLWSLRQPQPKGKMELPMMVNENIVSAGELERGIRCLMELGEEKVESLKEMAEK
uniref:anthocyanidin 3-O-glucosyltransferase n=1 Tax=Salix viminalis TaxID=40686 RepID=A0A6N2L8Q9_SALVM